MASIMLFELKCYLSHRMAVFWLAGYPVLMLIILVGLYGTGIQTDDPTESYRFRISTGLVTITILTTALYGMASAIHAMRQYRGLLNYLLLPVSTLGILYAILLSRIVIVFVFCTLFIIGAFISLDINLDWSFIMVVKFSIAVLTAQLFFFSIATLIIFVSKQISTIQGIVHLLNLYVIMSSDVFIPISSLPEWSQLFVTTSPFYYLNLGIRSAFYETTTSVFWLSSIILLILSVCITYLTSRQKILVPAN